ncbi:asparagine synthase-related protein [Nesterenkonia muleiensis]|uniref:asparagine synthase-related protein n=1 Tax=Nesterenkonia muleiensis TaxID=2282648 RepID=UPI000E751074|nr:asparagine synthase-related protein [Nesterenkonia muleiensis]
MIAQRLQPGAVCGVLGRMTEAHRQRADRMAEIAESEGVRWEPSHLLPGLTLRRTSSAAFQRDERSITAAWNAAGAVDQTLLDRSWEETARRGDLCGLRAAARGTGVLHGSVSGCQVLYVHITDHAVFFSTRLRWLAETAEQLTADWQAWSEILAFGAPLSGRTTFTEIRRLMPMEYVEVGDAAEGKDNTAQLKQAHWPWEDYLPQRSADLAETTGATVEAMAEHMRPHLRGAGNPMLSGGRDSRMLTALALREAAEPQLLTAWSTSSDAGSALEELVAARVAETLGIDHRIVTGHYDQFGQDFADYADAVDHQSSLHFWLMPVARRLRCHPGPVFDGIGGGVLLGGGFADPQDGHRMSRQELIAARVRARSRYLSDAPKVLRRDMTSAVGERARSGAGGTAARYADHPNAHTLTSYLLRTVPGIAQAPAKVLGGAQPTVMPMVIDEVASLALQLPHAVKTEGAWYPQLLVAADQRLRGMPTADDLTGTRHHKRRIASREGARYLAGLLQRESVSGLLSPDLAALNPADPQGLVAWQRLLNSQRPQHLIRGLAMLTLWLDEYGSRLRSADPEGIARA